MRLSLPRPRKHAPAPRRATVQLAKLFLDDIQGGVISLGGGEYRLVLEVGALNFDLKSPAEQEATVGAFRAFLNGLGYPIQIIVRVERLDGEEYLRAVRKRAAEESDPTLRELALAQIALVRELTASRLLLSRRFFVVVPSTMGPATPVGALRGLFGRRGTREAEELTEVDAKSRLAERGDELARGLRAVGLRTRVLGTPELVDLYYRTLCPVQAHVQPVRDILRASWAQGARSGANRPRPRSGGDW